MNDRLNLKEILIAIGITAVIFLCTLYTIHEENNPCCCSTQSDFGF